MKILSGMTVSAAVFALMASFNAFADECTPSCDVKYKSDKNSCLEMHQGGDSKEYGTCIAKAGFNYSDCLLEDAKKAVAARKEKRKPAPSSP